ncbi:hypothetical protein HYPSUDRAFT_745487 [Hypholoma sublateritium FD-334 SS-4]|uniref:Uncharacterized protein n=1 Tax=Hypholoma sublateritium (strain FD-334 SS-4) TaxID=945553 RepID=A0A0D2NXF2_HYPSF|nr:hypothetical protein HYPSUDRAFT_745487 [Hypholoma sublateritium FD-334 SS-4]
MPSIAFQSRVRTTAETCTLTMIIEHRFILGQPSDVVHRLKLPLDGFTNILLGPQPVFTIKGTVNNIQVSSTAIRDSHIARHFVEYLRMNVDDLGIFAASNAHISEDTDTLTLFFTGPQSLSIDLGYPPLHLVGFDVCYAWRTMQNSSSSEVPDEETMMNPFSPNLPLPYLTIVNKTVERFITFQVVKRYPLIFGTWHKQLTVESIFFSSIYNSMCNIMGRSPHLDFSDTCTKLLKLCKQRVERSMHKEVEALSDRVGSDFEISCRKLDAEDAFTSSMGEFYRLGTKRPLFKGMSLFCNLRGPGAESPGDDAQDLLELEHPENNVSDDANLWPVSIDDDFCAVDK